MPHKKPVSIPAFGPRRNPTEAATINRILGLMEPNERRANKVHCRTNPTSTSKIVMHIRLILNFNIVLLFLYILFGLRNHENFLQIFEIDSRGDIAGAGQVV